MKIKSILFLLLIALPAYAQEPAQQKHLTPAERKATREAREAKAKDDAEKIDAGLKERATVFDLQFYTGAGAVKQTFEINTLKGSYRFENAKEKKLIEGSGVVKVDGRTVTLTDWPRVVASINVCGGSVRAFIERERMTFAAVGDDECEEDDCDEEDGDEDGR
jgi:hypothetical protein